MRIIVAGIGEVGMHLAAMLANSYHDITAIDPDEGNLARLLEGSDLVTVPGSATSLRVLKQAEVEKTDLFIAVAQSEGTNILSAILAKQLGAKRVIARIDDNEYLRPQHVSLFNALGIDTLIYPEKLASQVIIGLLGEAGTMEYIDFAQGRLSLSVFKITSSFPYLGWSLEEVARACEGMDYRIVAIARNGETIIPEGDELIVEGDALHIISNQKGVGAWRRLMGEFKPEVENIMVLGASRMGVRTCLDLESKMKRITLIERNAEKCQQIAKILQRTLIVHGDARDMDLLISENLGKVDVLIAVTGSSEINVLACMAARRAGVHRVIAEVENIDYIALAESIGIDSVVNKKLITASSIFRYTMGSNISSLHCLMGSDAEVLEFVAKEGSKSTRGRLKDLNFPRHAIVGGLIRGDRSFIANGETEIQAGDRVVVFTLGTSSDRLANFFR